MLLAPPATAKLSTATPLMSTAGSSVGCPRCPHCQVELSLPWLFAMMAKVTAQLSEEAPQIHLSTESNPPARLPLPNESQEMIASTSTMRSQHRPIIIAQSPGGNGIRTASTRSDQLNAPGGGAGMPLLLPSVATTTVTSKSVNEAAGLLGDTQYNNDTVSMRANRINNNNNNNNNNNPRLRPMPGGGVSGNRPAYVHRGGVTMKVVPSTSRIQGGAAGVSAYHQQQHHHLHQQQQLEAVQEGSPSVDNLGAEWAAGQRFATPELTRHLSDGQLRPPTAGGQTTLAAATGTSITLQSLHPHHIINAQHHPPPPPPPPPLDFPCPIDDNNSTGIIMNSQTDNPTYDPLMDNGGSVHAGHASSGRVSLLRGGRVTSTGSDMVPLAHPHPHMPSVSDFQQQMVQSAMVEFHIPGCPSGTPKILEVLAEMSPKPKILLPPSDVPAEVLSTVSPVGGRSGELDSSFMAQPSMHSTRTGPTIFGNPLVGPPHDDEPPQQEPKQPSTPPPLQQQHQQPSLSLSTTPHPQTSKGGFGVMAASVLSGRLSSSGMSQAQPDQPPKSSPRGAPVFGRESSSGSSPTKIASKSGSIFRTEPSLGPSLGPARPSTDNLLAHATGQTRLRKSVRESREAAAAGPLQPPAPTLQLPPPSSNPGITSTTSNRRASVVALQHHRKSIVGGASQLMSIGAPGSSAGGGLKDGGLLSQSHIHAGQTPRHGEPSAGIFDVLLIPFRALRSSVRRLGKHIAFDDDSMIIYGLDVVYGLLSIFLCGFGVLLMYPSGRLASPWTNIYLASLVLIAQNFSLFWTALRVGIRNRENDRLYTVNDTLLSAAKRHIFSWLFMLDVVTAFPVEWILVPLLQVESAKLTAAGLSIWGIVGNAVNYTSSSGGGGGMDILIPLAAVSDNTTTFSNASTAATSYVSAGSFTWLGYTPSVVQQYENVFCWLMLRHLLRLIRMYTLIRSSNPIIEQRSVFRLLFALGVAVTLIATLASTFNAAEIPSGSIFDRSVTYSNTVGGSANIINYTSGGGAAGGGGTTRDSATSLYESSSPPYYLFHSVYWGLTTALTVGYGDITPKTNTGKAVAMLTMVFGAAILSTMTAIATSFFATKDRLQQDLDDRKRMMTSMLEYFEVPWDLQKDVISSFPAVMEAHSRHAFLEMINELPEICRDRVEGYSRLRLLRQIALFQGIERDHAFLLAKCLKQQFVGAQDVVVLQGDIGSEMYFVVHGILDVLVDFPNGDQLVVATLRDGSFFGERGLLHDTPRTASVVAVSLAELLVLTRVDFELVVCQIPEVLEVFRRNVFKQQHAGKGATDQKKPQRETPTPEIVAKHSEENSQEHLLTSPPIFALAATPAEDRGLLLEAPNHHDAGNSITGSAATDAVRQHAMSGTDADSCFGRMFHQKPEDGMLPDSAVEFKHRSTTLGRGGHNGHSSSNTDGGIITTSGESSPRTPHPESWRMSSGREQLELRETTGGSNLVASSVVSPLGSIGVTGWSRGDFSTSGHQPCVAVIAADALPPLISLLEPEKATPPQMDTNPEDPHRRSFFARGASTATLPPMMQSDPGRWGGVAAGVGTNDMLLAGSHLDDEAHDEAAYVGLDALAAAAASDSPKENEPVAAVSWGEGL